MLKPAKVAEEGSPPPPLSPPSQVDGAVVPPMVYGSAQAQTDGTTASAHQSADIAPGVSEQQLQSWMEDVQLAAKHEMMDTSEGTTTAPETQASGEPATQAPAGGHELVPVEPGTITSLEDQEYDLSFLGVPKAVTSRAYKCDLVIHIPGFLFDKSVPLHEAEEPTNNKLLGPAITQIHQRLARLLRELERRGKNPCSAVHSACKHAFVFYGSW